MADSIKNKQLEIDAFDRASRSYDSDFTRSPLGQIYRKKVQNRLSALFKPGMLVLDIGCGTGDDAIFLARKGISVIAIDFSSGMLSKADSKVRNEGLSGAIELRHLPAENLSRLIEELPMGFDGLYSNFGPVNMVSDIQRFIRITARLLNPNGKALHVVMNRKPFFETFYYLMHLRFARAFDRYKGKTFVPVSGGKLPCNFYQPSELSHMFKLYFTIERIEALGVLLPPPYLSGHYRRHRMLYNNLIYLDSWLSNLPVSNSMGDHFIIELTRDKDFTNLVA